MPLNIKNSEAHEYAKKLAALTGQSLTDAVTRALEEAVNREEKVKEKSRKQLIEELDTIALHCASLPLLFKGDDFTKIDAASVTHG